jgi:hypothetical protein
MVSVSVFVVLLVLVAVGMYFRKLQPWAVVLGALFGLALATTPMGGPVLDGFQTLVDSLASAISSATGGA